MMTSMSDETARPMGQTQVDRPPWTGRTYRETGSAAVEGDAIAPPVDETASERGGKPSKGTPADKRKSGKGKKPGPKPKAKGKAK